MHDDESTRDRAAIAAALANAARFGKVFGIGLALLGLLGPVRFVPEGKYALAAVTFAAMALIGGFIFWFATRSDPRWSARPRALLDAPETITRIEHYTSSSSSGGMTMQWLRVESPSGQFAIKVSPKQMTALAQVMARHCPRAHVTVPGFDRPAPASYDA